MPTDLDSEVIPEELDSEDKRFITKIIAPTEASEEVSEEVLMDLDLEDTRIIAPTAQDSADTTLIPVDSSPALAEVVATDRTATPESTATMSDHLLDSMARVERARDTTTQCLPRAMDTIR